MSRSVLEMSRGVRRRLEGVVRRSREKDYARRALALLHLWETQGKVSETLLLRSMCHTLKRNLTTSPSRTM